MKVDFIYLCSAPNALTLQILLIGVMTPMKQPALDEDGISINRVLLERLCYLLHALIYHHTGYPELYSSLLALMSNYVSPPLLPPPKLISYSNSNSPHRLMRTCAPLFQHMLGQKKQQVSLHL